MRKKGSSYLGALSVELGCLGLVERKKLMADEVVAWCERLGD
jgi:hypothetical protein